MPEKMICGHKFTGKRGREAVFIATLQGRDCRMRTELSYKVTSTLGFLRLVFCFVMFCFYKGPEEYEVWYSKYNSELSSSLTCNIKKLTGLEYHSLKPMTLLKLVQ